MAATLEAWALGLVIAVAVAVPCGVVLGSLPGVRSATLAVVEFLRPIPSVALIVLVGLLIGPGLRMNVTLVVYAAIWPVLFNTIYGLDDADPVARETLRAFGFGRLAVIRFASLPGAAPFIATGIRLASSIALILTISTGYLTGRISGNGIGAFIADANTGAGNTALVLAAAFWSGVLGLVLNGVLVWAEHRVLPWQRAYRAGWRNETPRPLVSCVLVLAAASGRYGPGPGRAASSRRRRQIAGRMYHLWFSGPATHLFLTHDAIANILPSLGRVLAGLAIAAAAGGALGLALGRSAAAAGLPGPAAPVRPGATRGDPGAGVHRPVPDRHPDGSGHHRVRHHLADPAEHGGRGQVPRPGPGGDGPGVPAARPGSGWSA